MFVFWKTKKKGKIGQFRNRPHFHGVDHQERLWQSAGTVQQNEIMSHFVRIQEWLGDEGRVSRREW